MQAGRLRHRISIQALPAQASETRDSYGEPANTWQTEETVWASVEPLRGREFFSAHQEQAEVTHRVRMRYRAGLTPAKRLLFGARVLTIHSVINPMERNKELEVMAVEEV